MRDPLPEAAPADGPLVIGVGREDHRDDAAGLRVARLVRALLWPAVRLRECGGEPGALIEAWRDEPRVVVVDAMSSGAAAGSVRRLDVGARALDADFLHGSTHALGLAEAVELARSLGRLPAGLVIYGIEGQDFKPGSQLSYPVECSVREAALLVAEEILARWGVPPAPARP